MKARQLVTIEGAGQVTSNDVLLEGTRKTLAPAKRQGRAVA
ncbi:MAG: hypothetical protein U5P41_07095 [Gammaproteobacteria bacterium]|nr:hypothetical protein [Gammaproteobacteria bacterium]